MLDLPEGGAVLKHCPGGCGLVTKGSCACGEAAIHSQLKSITRTQSSQEAVSTVANGTGKERGQEWLLCNTQC